MIFSACSQRCGPQQATGGGKGRGMNHDLQVCPTMYHSEGPLSPCFIVALSSDFDLMQSRVCSGQSLYFELRLSLQINNYTLTRLDLLLSSRFSLEPV